MKNLLMIFVFLSANQQCNKTNEVHLIKATSQAWSGGAAAMRGMYYTIYVGGMPGSDFKFDSLWAGGKRLALEVKPSKTADTLVLLANAQLGARMPGSTFDPSQSIDAKPPIEGSAEGVVGYFFQGTRKYFLIPTFEILKPLAYP